MNLSVREILHILFKHKKMLLLTFLTVVIPAGIGVLLREPSYQATGSFMLVEPPDSLRLDSSRRRLIEDYQIFNEIQSMTSPSFLRVVVETMGNSVEADHSARLGLGKLRKGLAVQRVPFTTQLDASFIDGDPARAAAVVNAILDAFPRYQAERFENPATREFHSKRRMEIEAQIDEKEEGLRQFELTHDLIELDSELSYFQDAIRYVSDRLIATNTDLDQGLGKINKLKAKLTVMNPEQVLQTERAVDPTIHMLDIELMNLVMKRAKVLQFWGPGHPDVKSLDGEIESLQAELDQRGPDGRVILRERVGVSRSYQMLYSELHEQEVKRAQQSAKRDSLIETRRKLEAGAARLKDLSYEYHRRMDELEELRARLLKFSKSAADSKMEEAMDKEGVSIVKVLKRAGAPSDPLPSGSLLTMVLAVIVGFAGGIGVALTIEFMRPTFHTDLDVERILGLPVLARIPELPQRI